MITTTGMFTRIKEANALISCGMTYQEAICYHSMYSVVVPHNILIESNSKSDQLPLRMLLIVVKLKLLDYDHHKNLVSNGESNLSRCPKLCESRFYM